MRVSCLENYRVFEFDNNISARKGKGKVFCVQELLSGESTTTIC